MNPVDIPYRDWSPGMKISLQEDPHVWYILHTRKVGGFDVWDPIAETRAYLSIHQLKTYYELSDYIGGFNYIVWNPSEEQLVEFAKQGRKLGTELHQFKRDMFK
jgi:hypothetical protein